MLEFTLIFIQLFLLSACSFFGDIEYRIAHGLSNGDPEEWENITEIIKSNGYYVEEHRVETDDDYILLLIRMRKSKTLHGSSNVVFLQHGLLDSAHAWVSNLRNQSLGFILADAGYDVWLGNSRGNTYSRGHKTLSPDNRPYWDFTWDEMAKYDLPASLYYVLNRTKSEKLAYVGHSQGCMIALAQFSRDATLQSRISVFIALAPAAYLSNVETPLRYVAPLAVKTGFVLRFLNHGEFLPSSTLFTLLGNLLCAKSHLSLLCSNVIFLIAGYDTRNLNVTRIPVYVSHSPAGTSSKNILHLCQGTMTDRFQSYDYGLLKNLWIYGQRRPPEVDLSRLDVLTAIFYGGHDWLTGTKDISRLAREINKTLIGTYFIKHYNHLDFVWGLDAGYILYPHVLDILKRYS